jgi:hypothetical protein
MAHARSFASAVAIALTLAGPAAADHFHGTRSELLVEVGHSVSATLHRGWAELRVRRTVHNGGRQHDQAVFMIDLPDGAVATRLATLGALGGRPHWFEGELMEAEAAAEKYRELTGLGAYYPKDPALLSWRSQDALVLQVFPCPPKQDKSVEYSLLLPTRYSRGAHRLRLPGMGTHGLPATISLGHGDRRDRLQIANRIASGGTQLRTALGSEVEIGLVPAQTQPLAGELAVVPFTDTRVLTRFAVHAAPRISRAPTGAFVVIAIDASRSIRSSVLQAQKAAAAAYLSHLPDARVEVITFDREAHRRYGAFVPAPRAGSELTTRMIEQKNGSAVDLALHEADRLLASAPAGRPRRLLLMTDTLVRSALRPERLKSALGKSGAIAHIVALHEGAPSLRRDDDHSWAIAPRATGGLFWQAAANASGREQKELRELVEEWVRPLRIHHLRLYSPDIAVGLHDSPEERLDEGEGIEQTFIASRSVSWIRVEGEVWSKRIEHVIQPDPAAAKRWAALVFGSELFSELKEPEMMTLAMRGGAVSPVTSYLAIEPGVRPSTEGLDWGGSGQGFGSARGGMLSVRMGSTSVSRRVTIDREGFLQNALARSWRACGGVKGTASVSFETTYDEVVDVTSVSVGASKDPLLERCLSEAAWELALSAEFDEEWNVWSIDV